MTGTVSAVLALLLAGLAGIHNSPALSAGEAGTADAGARLIGWWKFDEAVGATAADSSGHGNEATIRNGGWGEGRFGGALEMDGGDDGIVTVAMSESLKSATGDFTLTAWTYRTAEHNVAIVAHAYPTLFLGFHGDRFKWQIGDEAGGFWGRVGRWLGLVSASGASCYSGRDHRAALGRWIHVAATYDGEYARLYADGAEICRQPFSGSLNFNDSPLTISGYLSGTGGTVDEITGRLDDVRFYDRALGAGDIRAIFLGGAP
jgi:hypothetical protein